MSEAFPPVGQRPWELRFTRRALDDIGATGAADHPGDLTAIHRLATHSRVVDDFLNKRVEDPNAPGNPSPASAGSTSSASTALQEAVPQTRHGHANAVPGWPGHDLQATLAELVGEGDLDYTTTLPDGHGRQCPVDPAAETAIVVRNVTLPAQALHL